MPATSPHPHGRTSAGACPREGQPQERDVRRTVRQLIREYRAPADAPERRREERADFVRPVRVVTEDLGAFAMLTRDLSAGGIRLLGTRRLLGQKVHVLLPAGQGSPPWDFLVHVLWTRVVGDGLVENGGAFLGVSGGGPAAEG